MLVLKELERRLDDALSNETNDSLSNWLLGQRKDNHESFLRVGSIEQFKGNPYSFNQDLPLAIQYTCVNVNNPSEQLSFAA